MKQVLQNLKTGTTELVDAPGQVTAPSSAAAKTR
jgi:hypothetical protein